MREWEAAGFSSLVGLGTWKIAYLWSKALNRGSGREHTRIPLSQAPPNVLPDSQRADDAGAARLSSKGTRHLELVLGGDCATSSLHRPVPSATEESLTLKTDSSMRPIWLGSSGFRSTFEG